MNEQERIRNREKNRRNRASSSLWNAILHNPGSRLGDIMQIGRSRGVPTVDLWPRELRRLTAGGHVRQERSIHPVAGDRENSLLFAVDEHPPPEVVRRRRAQQANAERRDA